MDTRITEQRNTLSANIDLASALEVVDLMNGEDRTIADAVATQRQVIARLVDAVAATFRSEGRLLYVGAGTSGRLGVLDASECPPTFGSDPAQVQGLIAGGERAMFRAQEGAEDSADLGASEMERMNVGATDVVVGIAASGTTPFVRGAVRRAKAQGATTAFIACTPIDDVFAQEVDHLIVVVTGPEIVTGSTRLKAGTATKMILNMITTGAFVRSGKTWGNLMVDLQATNAKLQDRSERILMEVCDLTRDDARRLLQDAGGHVKSAIVMQSLGVDLSAAQLALRDGGGVIRRIVRGGKTP